VCVRACKEGTKSRSTSLSPLPPPFPNTSSRSDTHRGKVCVALSRSDTIRKAQTSARAASLKMIRRSIEPRKRTTKVTANLSSACAPFRVSALWLPSPDHVADLDGGPPSSDLPPPIPPPVSLILVSCFRRSLLSTPHFRSLFFPFTVVFHSFRKVRKLSDSAVTYGDTIMYHKCDRLNNRMETSESRRGGVVAGMSAFAERAFAGRRETNERTAITRTVSRTLYEAAARSKDRKHR